MCGCSRQTAFLVEESSVSSVIGNAGDVSSEHSPTVSGNVQISAGWRPLAARLAKDGLHGPNVDALLASLEAQPTQAPMGRKIRELYNRHILHTKQAVKPARHYKGVVSAANAKICRDYIGEHKSSFAAVTTKYGVPDAVAAALLFVETRLGRVLADVPENAFYTLASMAMSREPQDISEWLSRLPGYEQHLEWITANMHKRSDWAYAEVRALVSYMLQNNIRPQDLPGSIYGAIGLCQFMPSNISTYGEDGDKDGIINLYSEADAIASLGKYLYLHGWRRGMSYKEQHKILMTYNHSTTYAYTILDLALMIEGKQWAGDTPKNTKKRRNNEKK